MFTELTIDSVAHISSFVFASLSEKFIACMSNSGVSPQKPSNRNSAVTFDVLAASLCKYDGMNVGQSLL